MNRARLNTLSEHLNKIPLRTAKRKFNMGVWVARTSKKDRERHGCGTTACAAGEAAYIPEFRELGLTFRQGNADDGGSVKFEGRENIDAMQRFFGLTYDQARFIFLFCDAKSPRAVARRIDFLVDADKAGLLFPTAEL